MSPARSKVYYISYSDFATGAVCGPGIYHITYCRKLVDLIVHSPIDFYDLSEHLDDVLETDHYKNNYITFKVIDTASDRRLNRSLQNNSE